MPPLRRTFDDATPPCFFYVQMIDACCQRYVVRRRALRHAAIDIYRCCHARRRLYFAATRAADMLLQRARCCESGAYAMLTAMRVYIDSYAYDSFRSTHTAPCYAYAICQRHAADAMPRDAAAAMFSLMPIFDVAMSPLSYTLRHFRRFHTRFRAAFVFLCCYYDRMLLLSLITLMLRAPPL